MTCTHEAHEKDVAVDADGYCPLCLAAELEATKAKLDEFRAITKRYRVLGQWSKACYDSLMALSEE